MPSVSPSTISLLQSETQSFAQSGITSPKWGIIGGGSVNSGGLFTAPGVAGTTIVRAMDNMWSTVDAAFSNNADNTLTVLNASAYSEALSYIRLNSVGDYVEFSHDSHREFRLLDGTHIFDMFQGLLRYDGVTQHTPSPGLANGDVIRVERITGNQITVKKNGGTLFTFSQTVTNPLQPGWRIYPVLAQIGDIFPAFIIGGSGISGYSEAQAVATTLANLLTGHSGVELYCEARLMSQSDASIVSSFTDQSGKGRHLTTSTNYPTFETNEINGHPVIRFHGTSNPLKNTAQFTIRCGWILAKYLDTSFSDFKGLLSDLVGTTILVSNNSGANFFDMEMELFEFRSNDRIYPETAMPAPMQVFKLIFFRFWKSLPLDGIQLGQQTTFTGRKWFGDVPFLALYSRDFCERDIRKYSKAIADAYGLALADVYPYQADKGTPRTPVQSVNFYDPPEGARISEVLDDAKLDLDLKFSARRQSEFQEMKAYHASHFGAAVECIYRDYDVIPPEDISGYINSQFQASGSVNDWRYSFKFKEK